MGIGIKGFFMLRNNMKKWLIVRENWVGCKNCKSIGWNLDYIERGGRGVVDRKGGVEMKEIDKMR